MPPARKKWKGPCWNPFLKRTVHHLIWYGRDGVVTIGCAHCGYRQHEYLETDRDHHARMVEQSRRQHAADCAKPVR
jgi:hypothetical protein